MPVLSRAARTGRISARLTRSTGRVASVVLPPRMLTVEEDVRVGFAPEEELYCVVSVIDTITNRLRRSNVTPQDILIAVRQSLNGTPMSDISQLVVHNRKLVAQIAATRARMAALPNNPDAFNEQHFLKTHELLLCDIRCTYWSHRLGDDLDELRSDDEFARSLQTIIISIWKRIWDTLLELHPILPRLHDLPYPNPPEGLYARMLYLEQELLSGSLRLLQEAHWVYQKLYDSDEDTAQIEQSVNLLEDELRRQRLPFTLCLNHRQPDTRDPEGEDERRWEFEIQTIGGQGLYRWAWI